MHDGKFVSSRTVNEGLFCGEGNILSSAEEIKMRNPTSHHRDAPVTVSFPVPRKAASKLRSLAISKDRRLLDLGVLAVQINEGESIVLGIKLGKQRIKKTEVDADKQLRGRPAGRVVKRPSTCRNVATVHHMPAATVSQAHKLNFPAAQIAPFSLENNAENLRKRAAQSDGDVMANELFSVLSPGTATDNKPSSSCQFRLSDYTSSFENVLSLKGQSSGSLAKESRPSNQRNSSSYAIERSSISMQKSTQGAGTVNESCLPAARRLSSPNSHRAYSSSPGSDSSSTSSEENTDAHQLIYNCFVDRSKYCAGDMLKQLAIAHAGKKDTPDVPAVNTSSALPCTVKTGATSTKSSSNASFLLERSRVLSNSRRSAVPGSYREHVKNIRCNSLTSLTTTTSTVNSTLKTPASPSEQLFAFPSSRINLEKPLGIGDRKLVTQHTTTHLSLPKPSTASQTKGAKTGSSQTATYHGGRKVLWSSANAFPSSVNLSTHLPVNKSTTAIPQVNSPSSKSVTLLPQVLETTAPSSCMKSNAATCSKTIKSTPNETHFSASFHPSNKLPGQELGNESGMTQSDSKTVIMKTPSLSFDPQESVILSNVSYSSPQLAVSTSSPCIPGVTNVVQTESQGTKFVQNLTLARSTLPPSTVVIAGTNTQTTWSNQQVSPTYFVGTQAQYGLYPTQLYSTDVNNNQLGQQAVTATYPLNYVYPISFVYPYLSMAQANNTKNTNNEKEKHQNGDAEVEKTDAAVVDTVAKVTKIEPDVIAQAGSGSTVNTQTTASSTPPVQTQFIDLASSMRYWQQLNLLYRSRWQALASCNLSNVATATSNQANAAATVTPAADESSQTVPVIHGETTVTSISEEQSFSKLEISQANPSKDSYTVEHKPTNELCAETPCSEILQRVKPEINLEEDNGSKDMTSDRPSVIVVATCKDGSIEMSNSSALEMKIQCKQEEFDEQEFQVLDDRRTRLDLGSYETSFSEEDISTLRLHHEQLSRDMAAGDGMGRRFCGSTPKLSFIPDSSIAYVNVGNSNGNSNGNGFGYTNGAGTHAAARRTCK